MEDQGARGAVVCDLNRAVREVMNREPRTVSPQASLLAAAEIMFKHELRHLILVDSAGVVSGVISQRDLLMQLIRILAKSDQSPDAPPHDAKNIGTVAELIKSPPIAVPPDLPMLRAAAILASQRVGCLPVVDSRGCLQGMLGISQVLSAVTRKIGLQEFEFFAPTEGGRRRSPAFFRRISRLLVLPLESLGDMDLSLPYVQLGYDPATGRIVVKFIPDEQPGSRKVSRERECLTVPASDFVSHYEIKSDGSAYEIINHTGYLVLAPKQPGSDSTLAAASSAGSRKPGRSEIAVSGTLRTSS